MLPLLFISTCCILEGLLIFVQFRNIELMEKFLWVIYVFSQGCYFQTSPRQSWTYCSPTSERYPYLLERLWSWDAHNDARDLFMRLWDSFETSAPVCTQEQDNQNKANFKRSRRISGLEELATVQIINFFSLYT